MGCCRTTWVRCLLAVSLVLGVTACGDDAPPGFDAAGVVIDADTTVPDADTTTPDADTTTIDADPASPDADVPSECGSSADCNDGNPCTADVCDADGLCNNAPANAGAVCRPAADACDLGEDRKSVV